jgi:hypothetical protein
VTRSEGDGSGEVLAGGAGSRPAPAVVGLAAVAAQLALGFLYVGVVVLTVPARESYAFWAAWGVGLLLVLLLPARRSWAAVLVPLIWLGVFIVLRFIGEAFLGWGLDVRGRPNVGRGRRSPMRMSTAR